MGIAATVGFFDGVHIGHRHLLSQLKALADREGMQSMAVTFAEHPRMVLQSDYRPLLLLSPEDRFSQLSETGVDFCRELHFTPELSRLTAREFMRDVLRDQFGISVLLMGHDHRFGHDGVTRIEDYQAIGAELGIRVFKADALLYEGTPVSSSRIRRCLTEGDAKSAAAMLGHPYQLKGTVVHGNQNGRKMNCRTANLGPYCKLMQIPRDGVYAALASVLGKTYYSMVNIGFRPTVGNSAERTIEAHLLDFNQEIYGEELTLQFIEYVREERRFDSLDLLAEQLFCDKNLVNSILSTTFVI